MSDHRAEAIRRWAQAWVEPDPHAADLPGHAYIVSSVYLDSVNLALYRETLEGNCDREKLRVRSYPSVKLGKDVPVFLEVKRRRNRVVEKVRASVDSAFAKALLSGEEVTVRQPDVAEFVAIKQRRGLGPVVRVDYNRQAYVGAFGDGARLTLDRALRGSLPSDLWVRGGGWLVEDRSVILELKFNGALPGWMQQLVRRFDLDRRSYSKYATTLAKGQVRAGTVGDLLTHMPKRRATGA